MKITNKLREELRKEWISELLSGNYKQGRFQLRSIHNEFCCLGVGCDILVKRGLLPDWSAGDNSYFINAQNRVLPDIAVEVFGLCSDGGGHVEYEGCAFSLASRNDAGITFEEIARLLQEGGYWKENVIED